MNADATSSPSADDGGGGPEPVVLYEEADTVAFITLNRPERMNTLTEGVIARVADGIDRATASRSVRSIVLRGSGPTLTAGYDLNPGGAGVPTRQRSSGGAAAATGGKSSTAGQPTVNAAASESAASATIDTGRDIAGSIQSENAAADAIDTGLDSAGSIEGENMAADTATAAGPTSSGGTHDELYDSWGSPFDAPGPEPRAGAWDPVRDWQFMGHNVKRFMKIWECPKPVLGQIHGWAIGGATDMILCCDLLFMASDAHIGYAPSRIYGTPTTMMWVYRLGLEHAKQFLLSGDAIDAETAHRIGLVAYVHPPDQLSERVEAFARRLAHIPANQLALNKLLINQAYENMGLRTSQLLGTFFDGVTRHTEEAYRWAESFQTKGFRQVIAERDAPHGDYGERSR